MFGEYNKPLFAALFWKIKMSSDELRNLPGWSTR